MKREANMAMTILLSLNTKQTFFPFLYSTYYYFIEQYVPISGYWNISVYSFNTTFIYKLFLYV